METSDIRTLAAGPELDALVATKVMGWRISKNGHYWVDTLGEHMAHLEDGPWLDAGDKPWSPSEDMDAAWDVVKLLRKRFGIVEVHGHDDTKDPGADDEDSDVTFWECGVHELFCSGGTAPLAICRAALRAVQA